MPSKEEVEREEAVVHEAGFEVDARLLYYITAPVHYANDPGPKQTGHSSVDEISINFCRTVVGHADLSEHSNHGTARCIPSWNLPSTEDIENNPGMLQFEVMYRSSVATSGRSSMLPLEK